MRISDGSSDVCASELAGVELEHIVGELLRVGERGVGRRTEPRVERLERGVLAIERDQPWRRREVRNRGKRAVEEILADEQQFRPPIAKDEADFGGREAAVDRCETGPRTRRPEKERITAVMVFGQRRNDVTRRDVRSAQRGRDQLPPRTDLPQPRLALPPLP